MKRIGDLIRFKNKTKKPLNDEKSIFYVFNKIVEREYGNRGLANLKPAFLKNKKLFVKAKNSIWANELWLTRQELIESINKEIGSVEVDEIKIKS